MKEDAEFVKKCIVSCSNAFQLECCLILMQLFEAKYKDTQQLRTVYLDILGTYQDKETEINIYA